jgi:hypothetical protein
MLLLSVRTSAGLLIGKDAAELGDHVNAVINFRLWTEIARQCL